MKRALLYSVALCLCALHLAWGAVPDVINYQGQLIDAGTGQPVPNGSYSLTFRLYEVAAGGTAVWTETQSVVITGGSFVVYLGSVATLPTPWDRPYWLGISIASGAELTPRVQLASSPYSLNSRSLQTPAYLAGTWSLPLISLSNTGSGPCINATASSGDGIIAWAFNGVGVYGRGDSAGVEGYTTNGVAGVMGLSDRTNGCGVRGVANTGAGAHGVWGQSWDGIGVSGMSLGAGIGVYAMSVGSDAISAEAYADNKSGIFAVNTNPLGYAGYFTGRVHVNGTLSKAAGSFKIDHPLDPANKYLQHSFVESPDMMNIYNGNTVLDQNGEAVVLLPAYFEALNQEFRYQLTCLGGFAPLYIAQEVTESRFLIAGGTPGLKVSWQVTGIRRDAWAEAHRIQVEVDKRGPEKGKYLSPVEHGQPETAGIDYERVHMPKPKAEALRQ